MTPGYYRLFGVVVVLDAFLVALQPIIRRLAGRPPPADGRFTLVFEDGRRLARAGGPDRIRDALRRAKGRVKRIELGDE